MKKLISICLLLLPVAVSAQPGLFEIEIYQGIAGSNPLMLTAFKDRLYFAAGEATAGRELRSYDTANGLKLVNDVQPGPVSSMYTPAPYLKMGVLDGKLYYPADNGIIGTELYEFDGVSTHKLVADIQSGAGNSSPAAFTTIGHNLYFVAYTSDSGFQVRQYDTTSKTVRTVTAFANGKGTEAIPEMTVFNNKLYISGGDTVKGGELYAYDPATQQTTLVDDIFTGKDGSTPFNFTELNNKLYFSAYTYDYGQELYEYDPLNGPPTRLTDLNADSFNGTSSFPKSIVAYKGKVYFSGYTDTFFHDQLYAYDPVSKNTSLVQTINAGKGSRIWGFTVYHDTLYFSAKADGKGQEVWRYDGINPAYQLTTINSGGDANPVDFTVHNHSLYFNAIKEGSGPELYRFNDSSWPNVISVQNVSRISVANVYPNPTSGNATISFELTQPQRMSISVFDMSGKMVYSQRSRLYSDGQHTIPLQFSSFGSGTYLYCITSADGMMLLKGRIVKM